MNPTLTIPAQAMRTSDYLIEQYTHGEILIRRPAD
jgi:hypothetical protein